MRKGFTLVLLLVISFCSFCQVSPNSAPDKKSNVEMFLNREGVALLENRHSIGTISGTGAKLHITGIVVTDLKNSTKIGGVVIVINDDYGETKYASNFIDFDEIETIIQFLTYFKENHLATKPDDLSILRLRTRGGCYIGFQYSPTDSPTYQSWTITVDAIEKDKNNFTSRLNDSTKLDELIKLFKDTQTFISDKISK